MPSKSNIGATKEANELSEYLKYAAIRLLPVDKRLPG